MASPTLSLDQDTTSRLSQALADPSVDPHAAVAAAQQYQAQKASAPPAQPEGFLDKAGSFIKDNLSTIGSVGGSILGGIGGALLTVPTGGIINPITGAIAGGAIGGGGGEAAKEKLNGQSLDAGAIAGQAALGGATEAGGQLLGAGVKVGGKILSGALGKEADALVLKGLGSSDSQLFNFATKHGLTDAAGNATPQAVTDYMKARGLAGAGIDEIASKVENLQGQFDGLIKNSGITVDQGTLRKNMMDRVMPFLESTDPQDHKIAETILQNFENIDAKLGESPSLADVNSLRQAYDGKVKYGMVAQDPEQFGPKKAIADTLRHTVQEAANAAGAATDAGTLRETGQELSKLYDLQSIAEKGSFKGVSRATPGIANYLSSMAFGSATGPVGHVVGGFLPGLINNPKSLAILSKLSGAAGNAVGRTAATVGGALANPAVAAGVGGVANAAMNGALDSSPSAPAPGAPPVTPPGAAPASQPSSGISRDQYAKAMSEDLATTGGRFQNQITAAFQAQAPDLTQGLSTAANATQTLENLYSQAGGAKSPLAGSIENALSKTGYAKQNVAAYNDQASAIGQEIISQIYGSGGTSDERDQILKNIPQVTDSPYVAKSKLATLKSVIAGRLGAIQNSTVPTITGQISGPSLNLSR